MCHSLPLGGCDQHGWAKLLCQRWGDHFQVVNVLFSPFMGKLSGCLHIMLSLVESALKSHCINCVASPLVHTHKLMGIPQRLIIRHPLTL